MIFQRSAFKFQVRLKLRCTKILFDKVATVVSPKAFLNSILLMLVVSSYSSTASVAKAQVEKDSKVNFLLITADDLNWDSVGAYGSQVDNITPNIDAFAKEGVRFNNAHVTTGVCQVSRGVLATGLYPHQSGIDGFYHTNKDIDTVIKTLQQHGYFTAVKGKVDHSTPRFKTRWDLVERKAPGKGRDKDKYYQFVRKAIQQAKHNNQPFYIMANSHDPHRPFSGSEQERRKGMKGKVPNPSRTYQTEEIRVPSFLPDIKQVRREIAEYTSSVRRFDDTFGAILAALKDENVVDTTMVTFLSDNGMAFPFAKSNNYLNSTKTPWVVRFPDQIKNNYVDKEHFISGIDFFPTVLETANIEIPESLVGRSYLPLLKGRRQTGRDHVFTMYYETSAGNAYPIRAVIEKQYSYIFNPWADGKYRFKNESQSGRSWKAMLKAGKEDPTLAKRNLFFSHRTLEELYDYSVDPNALNNLIHQPHYRLIVEKLRAKLRQNMIETNDPLIEAFDYRDNPERLSKIVESLRKNAKQKHRERKNK